MDNSAKLALERSLARLDHIAQLLTAPEDPALYPFRQKVLELADELYEFIEKVNVTEIASEKCNENICPRECGKEE